jgi:hypothetical protein
MSGVERGASRVPPKSESSGGSIPSMRLRVK